jgi:NADH-quinone oxidoreductase subunit C
MSAEEGAALGTNAAMPDLHALAERLGDAALAVGAPLGQPTLLLECGKLRESVKWLRDERGYQFLRSVTAVDFPEVEPRFQVVYHLMAMPQSALDGNPTPTADAPFRALRLKVPVSAEDACVDSLVPLYETANWLEREVWDLFGIDFADHPDLRRILLPETFEGHPLRKDHPIEYEEVAFSFNQDEIHRRKAFAKK